MTYIIHTYNLFFKISNALYIQICLHSDSLIHSAMKCCQRSFTFILSLVWSEVQEQPELSLPLFPPPHTPFFNFIFIGGIELTSLFKTLKHKFTQHLILQAESNGQKWKDSKVFQDHALLYADECFPFAELMSQPHPSSVSSSSDIVLILLKAYNTL